MAAIPDLFSHKQSHCLDAGINYKTERYSTDTDDAPLLSTVIWQDITKWTCRGRVFSLSGEQFWRSGKLFYLLSPISLAGTWRTMGGCYNFLLCLSDICSYLLKNCVCPSKAWKVAALTRIFATMVSRIQHFFEQRWELKWGQAELQHD